MNNRKHNRSVYSLIAAAVLGFGSAGLAQAHAIDSGASATNQVTVPAATRAEGEVPNTRMMLASTSPHRTRPPERIESWDRRNTSETFARGSKPYSAGAGTRASNEGTMGSDDFGPTRSRATAGDGHSHSKAHQSSHASPNVCFHRFQSEPSSYENQSRFRRGNRRGLC